MGSGQWGVMQWRRHRTITLAREGAAAHCLLPIAYCPLPRARSALLQPRPLTGT